MAHEQLIPFDPRAIPPRPMVDIRISLDRSGREYALVDGVPVVARADETARQAAVRVVAGLVDEIAALDEFGRRCRAVRARVQGTGREAQTLIVHRERRIFVPSEGNDPASAPHLVDALTRPAPALTSALVVAGALSAPSVGTATIGDAAWSSTFLDDAHEPDPRARQLSFAVPAAIAARTATCAITVPVPGAASGRPTATRPTSPARPAASKGTPPAPTADVPLLGRAAPPASEQTDSTPVASARTNPDVADLARAGSGPTPAGARVARSVWPIVAVVLAAALVLGALAWSAASFRSSRATPPTVTNADAPEPVTFPGVAPSGWSGRARWSTGPLDPAAGPVVPVGTDALAYVTSSRVLTLADAVTGAARWRAELPDGAVSGVGHTRVADAEVLAVQTGATLSWWKVSDGSKAGHVSLPAGAKTTYLGGAPLVGLDSSTVGVLDGGELRKVPVPGGAFALAARPDNKVTAASPKGWWHLRPDTAPGAVTAWESTESALQAPQATPSVVGYLGSSILTMYPRDRSGRAHVVVHTDRASDVRMSFRGPLVPDAGPQRWHPSPGATWGVLGRTLVDLRSGSVADLGSWTTTWVTADTAYGTVGGRPAVAGPARPRGVRAAKESTPEAVGVAGAAVRTRSSAGESVYVLPPA